MKLEVSTSDFNSPKKLWVESQDYLRSVGTIYVDRYVPFILSSIGAHVANLRNKNVEDKGNLFHGVAGGTPDLRLHLLTIAPPGFSKSYFQNKFFNKYDGIAATFPNEEIGQITEAGLVGSFDSEGHKIKGLSEDYDKHIIWSEEFAAQTKEMKVEHSANLDTAFLKLLDDGKVEKRLRSGKIEFQSYMTMHAGTQNERLDLASGMARRLFVIDATPDEEDVKSYVDAYRNSRGIRADFIKIAKLREQFMFLYDHFNIPGKLVFDSSYDEMAYGMNMTHVEIILFEKLAIGYNVMTNYHYGDQDIIIKADDKLRNMFMTAWVWRNIMMGESTNVQILKLVKSQDWTIFDLKKRLQSLGIHYAESSTRINGLLQRGVLKMEPRGQDGTKGRGRPASWIGKGPNWIDLWKYVSYSPDKKIIENDIDNAINDMK